MTLHSQLFLASASPRRREILTQLGVDCIQVANHFDESLLRNESAKDYVQRVARGKALSALQSVECDLPLPVLGADTTVVHRGQVLGKPKNIEHAAQLLQRLSGQSHQVLSSVVIAIDDKLWQATAETEVVFAKLDQTTIEKYCHTKEPMGKAGAYAIQSLGGALVETIKGSYTNVVGLPIYETGQLLEQANVRYALV